MSNPTVAAKTRRSPWKAPRLTEHGDLAVLTGVQNKNYGISDGLTFQGVAITNAS